MPGMRPLRASTDMGSINPGDAQRGCYSRCGDVCEQRLNFCMNLSGVSQSGRVAGSQAEIPAAWRRRDCDASALDFTLCAATVPADLAASRICSLWNVAAHDPQYFRSARIYVPQILQMDCAFGAAGAGGIGGAPVISRR